MNQDQLDHHPGNDAGLQKDPLRRSTSPTGRAHPLCRFQPAHYRPVLLLQHEDFTEERYGGKTVPTYRAVVYMLAHGADRR